MGIFFWLGDKSVFVSLSGARGSCQVSEQNLFVDGSRL